MSNNTLETKINLQPNSSIVEGSSRRPPGYVFNKEFNKGIDTYFGRAFFEKKGMGRNIERKIKGSERKQRKIKGNERKIKGK